MEDRRFDVLVRSLTRSRRKFLGGALVATAGWTGRAGVDAKKRKQKKVKFNGFGCVNVGSYCKSNGQCCSGICQGKKGKRKCGEHHSGGCTPARSICETDSVALSNCNQAKPAAQCLATTGNGGFCADSTGVDPNDFCQVCARDADCVALGYPAGSACAIVQGAPGCDGEVTCVDVNGSAGTACFPPGA